MPDVPAHIAALEARIRELDEAIAPLAEERERLIRSLEMALGPQNSHLINPYQSDNTEGMHLVEKKKHSESSKVRPGVEKLRKASLARGWTIHDLADKMRAKGHPDDERISQVYLSNAAAGVGTMSPRRAKLVEELIGFKATRSNWPKLLTE